MRLDHLLSRETIASAARSTGRGRGGTQVDRGLNSVRMEAAFLVALLHVDSGTVPRAGLIAQVVRARS